MLHVKEAAAVLATSLMLTTSAFALTPGRETSAQIQAFDAMKSKVSLADAVASAMSENHGQLLEIHFTAVNHYPTYNAVLLSGGKMIAVSIDPITGIVSPPKSISPGSGASLHDEQLAAEALSNPASTPRQVIDAAEQHGAGNAIDAWLTERNGKPAYVVGVVEAKQLHRIVVDPSTGKIAWQSRGWAMNSAMEANASTPGNREVRALNLLEAKGYRDFSIIHRDGQNFDVNAMLDGKKVMLTVHPATGQIVTRT